MRSKQTSLDKFQYLTQLRATNVHLFYRLLAQNVKVCDTYSCGPVECSMSS